MYETTENLAFRHDSKAIGSHNPQKKKNVNQDEVNTTQLEKFLSTFRAFILLSIDSTS